MNKTDKAIASIKEALDILERVPPTVDLCARLRALNKRLDDMQGVASKAIMAEAESAGGVAMGRFFQARLIIVTRRTLDAESIRAYLGDEVARFENVTESAQLRFSAAP